jgi:hypothetical protein
MAAAGGGGRWVAGGSTYNGSNAPHSISEGVCTAKISERTEKEGELTVMSPLDLHTMNARLEVSHCRAMYLWMSMILFTSLTGVNITPKRNMVSETISNMFIVMRLDVCNPCYCTSELAEHGFGNTQRSQREFTCSDFASHVEKENRHMQTMFEGDCLLLTPSLRAIEHNFLIIFNMA